MSNHEVAVSIDDQEVRHVKDMDQHLKWLVWNWSSSETSADTPDDRQWWEFWKIDKSRKKGLLVIGRYLLEGLDDFVRIAKSQGNPLEYKATILNSIGSLYDAVITGAKIPWWMKPFGSSLKNLVINVMASLLIDYIVKRYDGGQFA